MNGATKYKNTTRTITGAINFVSQTDVVLLCDTSLSIVDLTLLEIPQGNFSTQYKLYVVDKSNNASANNITIKAPTGLTVNNSATAVINVNGGVAVITISSNKTYNVAYNYTISGGGGNPLIIKNEGTQITPSATSIDFVGAPVTATAVGNDVTVTVTDNGGHPIAIENEGTQITPDVAKINFTGSIVNATAVGNDVTVDINLGFISVTYTNLLTLIGSSGLVPTQQYLITDAIFLNPAPLEQVAILVTAVTTNEISLSGSGIFLNADYQAVGNYSGVSGFVAQTGVYRGSSVYVIGDVCIWDNLNYVNISGANTGDPDSTPADWTLLTKTSTNGYITEIDIIKYNVATNQITYREDVRNNRIENNLATYLIVPNLETFRVFQWGNNSVSENTILGESYFNIKNQYGIILNNFVDNLTKISCRAYNVGTIAYNKFTEKTTLLIGINMGVLQENTFESVGNVTINNTGTTSVILQNNFKYAICSSLGNNADGGTIQRNVIYGNVVCEGGFSIINTGGVIEDNTFVNFNVITISNNTGTIIKNLSEKNGYLDVRGNSGDISNNVISMNGSIRVSGTLLSNNTGTISNNVVIGGLITVNINDGNITTNEVNFGSRLLIKGTNSQTIERNTLSNLSDLTVEVSNLGQIKENSLINESVMTVFEVSALTTIKNNSLDISTITIGSLTDPICEGVFNCNLLTKASGLFLKGSINGGVFSNNILNNSTVKILEVFNGIFRDNQIYNESDFEFQRFTPSTKPIPSEPTNVTGNYLNNTSVKIDNVINSFQYNVLTDSVYNIDVNQALEFKNNKWSEVSFITLLTVPNASILNTDISNAQFSCSQLSRQVDGGVIQNGIGTTMGYLNMDDPAIYDPRLKQLIIPLCLNTFFGYFQLQNCGGKNIETILNSSRRFPTRFFNDATATTVFFDVLSGVPLCPPDGLVSSETGVYPISYSVENNWGVTDYIQIQRSEISDKNVIQEYKHWL